jgi:nucleotide-binding universal stress UspA family protein
MEAQDVAAAPVVTQGCLAGGALRADAALVVNVWSSPMTATRSGAAFGPSTPPIEAELQRYEQPARRLAEEVAARARQGGLSAEARVARGTTPAEIATVLCDLAEDRGATLVVGRRGQSRLKEVVLGGVSIATVHDGRCPVLVVSGGEQ